VGWYVHIDIMFTVSFGPPAESKQQTLRKSIRFEGVFTAAEEFSNYESWTMDCAPRDGGFIRLANANRTMGLLISFSG
jgi:hypothetical protein